MGIHSLKKYQARRGHERFSDLPLHQRATAEAHYQRLCARWGDDLPQWRRAILVGRAKDLAIRPRDGTWARRMRRHGKRRTVAPTIRTLAPPPTDARNATTVTGTLPPMPDPPRPINLAAPSDHVEVPLPMSDPLFAPSPRAHTIRLDVRGTTASGTDGHDTAQRILRDLASHAFGQSPHFTIGVPGKDLPARFAWRLEVVPVP